MDCAAAECGNAKNTNTRIRDARRTARIPFPPNVILLKGQPKAKTA
jgi:hypothetical protein